MTTLNNGTNPADLTNLTVDEVAKLLPIIDEKALNYIREMLPIETEDPILVLNYVDTNQMQWQWNDQTKQQVANALTAHGGQQISSGPYCIRFATWADLLHSKAHVKNIVPWAFNLSPAGAQHINATYQQLNPGIVLNLAVATNEMIRTDVISFYSEQARGMALTLAMDIHFFQD